MTDKQNADAVRDAVNAAAPVEETISEALNNKNIIRKFKFIPVSEIINNLQPTRWLINGYIEQHTMTLIFGDPASGKSFIAIDKACCIATGTAYYGHDVRRGAVFYIAGEGHNGLARRFKAWEQHNGVSLENVPLYVAERPAQFYDEEHAKAVAKAVQELADTTGQEPFLIVIDTLARNFGGGDENSTKDMNLFIQHVDDLKDRWGATALIVHHTGHGDKSRARGAMTLKGALDHEYQIQKDASGNISLQNTKTKDGPDPAPLYFEIVTVTLSHNSDNNLIEGAALIKTEGQAQAAGKKLSPQKRRAVDILRNCLIDKGRKRHVRKDMAQVDCVTLDEYREALRLGNISAAKKPDDIDRSVRRVIDDLNSVGITVSYGNFIWLPDKSDKTGRTKTDSFPEPDGQDKSL
ncbi:MAG: helicase RepA family protein [Alphaproteobacteria bacterium]|nr:helicase RepA family protein [Alphaproteobacteria bacterium]